jgi:hypothetical protein
MKNTDTQCFLILTNKLRDSFDIETNLFSSILTCLVYSASKMVLQITWQMFTMDSRMVVTNGQREDSELGSLQPNQ